VCFAEAASEITAPCDTEPVALLKNSRIDERIAVLIISDGYSSLL